MQERKDEWFDHQKPQSPVKKYLYFKKSFFAESFLRRNKLYWLYINKNRKSKDEHEHILPMPFIKYSWHFNLIRQMKTQKFIEL